MLRLSFPKQKLQGTKDRAELERAEFEPLIKRSATRTARKQRVGPVFKLTGTNGAAQPVAKSPLFATFAGQTSRDPDGEHHREEGEEIDKDKNGQAGTNHGNPAVRVEGENRSLPQQKLIIPQLMVSAGENRI